MRHRIALVISDLDPGGAERQMVELAVGLARDEFEPQVLVLAPPSSQPVLTDRLRQAGVPLTFLEARHKWQLPAVIAALARRFREDGATLVQSFLHHANVAAALAARRAGVEIAVTGIRVAERRGGVRRWVERATDRFVTRHVCVSQAVAEYSARTVGLSREKLVMIPNGVDVQAFSHAAPLSPAELGLPEGGQIVAYVGRLNRQKRLDWLLRQWCLVAARQPDAHLVLVGDGPERDRLRRLAVQLGCASRVRFAGWRPDVPRILRTADVVVLTSAWEGMPNAVLEAMAAARPVVATDTEGVAEILGPLANDPAPQLVAADDPAAFVDSVVRFLGNASLASSVGLANRRRVADAFTMEQMVERYCRLYRQLLHG